MEKRIPKDLIREYTSTDKGLPVRYVDEVEIEKEMAKINGSLLCTNCLKLMATSMQSL